MRQKLLTLFLVLGLVALVPVAYSATQQVFQAGSGYEIITDTTSDLDISTKTTDGGNVHIRGRQIGTGLFVASSTNNVGIGTTGPNDLLQIYKAQTEFSGIRVSNDGSVGATTRAGIRFGEGITSDYAEISWFRSGADEFRIENKVAAGDITFRTNGGERMRIDQSGNVGIGASPTSNRLHVSGNIHATGNISADGNLTANVSAAQVSAGTFGSVAGKGNYRYDAAANSNPVLFVDATNERVGIGTTSPGNLLDVNATDAATSTVLSVLKLSHITSGVAASGLGTGITFFSERPLGGINLERAAIYGIAGTDPDDDGDLVFYTRKDTGGNGVNEKMRIDSNGNVGIGTTSPDAKLQLVGNEADSQTSGLAFFNLTQASNYPVLRLDNTAGGSVGDSQGLMINHAGNGFAIRVNDDGTATDSTPFVIDSSGNVGIGTTSPVRLLHLHTTSVNANTFQITNADTGATATDGLEIGLSSLEQGLLWNYENAAWRIATNNADRLYIGGDGLVGIGTTGPDAILQLLDTAHTNPSTVYSSFFAGTGGLMFRAAAADSYFLGNVYYNTTPAWIYASTGGGALIGLNGTAAGDITFSTAPSGTGGTAATLTDRVIIKQTGNVGIGDTSPAALLTVGSGDLFQVNSSGVVAAGTWNATALTDAYVSDTITVGASGSVNDAALSANVSLLGNSISGGEIVNDTVGDTQLAFNTGQHLTTGSDPGFRRLSLTDDGAATPLLNIVADDTGPWAIRFARDNMGAGDEVQVYHSAANTITFESNDRITGLSEVVATTFTGSATDLSCTDCIGTTEIADSYVLNTGDTMTGQLIVSVAGTDIVADKIDAGTVDPVYTIGGKRYATYMAGMTGVKEETTGVVRLKGTRYVIDFDDLDEGSDLWLFARAINVDGLAYIAEDGAVHKTTAEELFDNMTVLLTPGFDGRVWYEKDPKNKTVTVFAERNGEVSYRLTAPRFDWKGWSNYASDGNHEGFNLGKLLR